MPDITAKPSGPAKRATGPPKTPSSRGTSTAAKPPQPKPAASGPRGTAAASTANNAATNAQIESLHKEVCQTASLKEIFKILFLESQNVFQVSQKRALGVDESELFSTQNELTQNYIYVSLLEYKVYPKFLINRLTHVSALPELIIRPGNQSYDHHHQTLSKCT